MKKLIFMFFTLVSSLYSQSMIWENEIELGVDLYQSNIPIIFDENKNIISIASGNNTYYTILSFAKIDRQGNILNNRIFQNNKIYYSCCFKNNSTGYSVFCGADSNTFMISQGSLKLPLILNLYNSGDTTRTIYPYNLNNPDFYADKSFIISSTGENNIALGENWYNATVKSTVPYGTGTIGKSHIIISSFDDFGKQIWRKGYDSANGFSIYNISHLRLSIDSNLIVLFGEYLRNSEKTNQYYVRFTEIDKEGNLLKDFEFKPAGKELNPIDIVKLKDGSYILLGNYLDSLKTNFLWKIDKNGNVLKKIDMTPKYLENKFYGMKLTPEENIILYGYLTVSFSNGSDLGTYKNKLFLSKYGSNLEKFWDYEWHDHTALNYSCIKDILFIDENNIIISGVKDYFKIYIAKFNTALLDINENNNQTKIDISPNPVSDYLTINPVQEIEQIEIFSVLGEKVLKIIPNTQYSNPTTPLKIDVSSLAPGVYFVRVGTKVIKFIKI